MVSALQQLWQLRSGGKGLINLRWDLTIGEAPSAEKKRKREDDSDSPPAKKSKKDAEDSLSEDDKSKLESRIAKFIKANIPLWEKILEYGVRIG